LIVVVTGSTGLLGPYICEAIAGRHRVEAISRHGPHRCDLTDPAATRRTLHDIGASAIVHAAALTDVDQCERDPNGADRSNRLVVANVVAALAENVRCIYISTDQVYPDRAGPHLEGGEAPVNAYGRSKLAGEAEALKHPDTLVLRTNLFGPSRSVHRRSLSDFVVDGLRGGKPITLFRDSLFSPLHMATLASLIAELLETEARGVFNLGCREGTSKAEFGLAVARHLGLSISSARVGTSESIPGRAPRPHDLRMENGRAEALLGRALPTLEEEIRKL